VLDLLEQIVRRSDVGEALAVCTLVESRGSTPQRPPAMMLVLADGQTIGTIGGGCVEAEVRSRALRRLADDTSTSDSASLFTFQLNHDFGWDDGLVCGGTMHVAVHTIRAPAQASLFRIVRDELRAGRRAVLSIAAIDDAGEHRRFEHAIDPRPVLLIVGAGHVGAALAQIARQIDFATVVIDDRTDLNRPQLLAGATCISGPIDQTLAGYPIDGNTYVVIVTRGHKHDASALAAVIGSAARYIGMIGSKRKILTIFEELEQSGIPLNQLRRVHAPIGLRIGAVTPGEIAVSIAAELIAVRREASATPANSMRISSALLDRLRMETANPSGR
jgi:xanthine dehydrogenase accessory factor